MVAIGIRIKVTITDIPINSPNPLCRLTSRMPAFISRTTLFLSTCSVTTGSGMVTNNKAVQAINAPATSKSMTTVILKEVINNAPKAGPAILQTDCIAWFTPDIII